MKHSAAEESSPITPQQQARDDEPTVPSHDSPLIAAARPRSLSPTNANLPPLSSVLSDLPPATSQPLPAHQWRTLLNHPHGPADLLALMPYLQLSLDKMSWLASVKTLAVLLRYMGNYNMLAPVSTILRLFEERLDRAIKEDEGVNTPQSLEHAYKQIIRAFITFHRQSTIPTRPAKDKLNRTANDHTLHLVRALVDRLDRLPSSSSSPNPPTMSHDMRHRLFDKPILHPALMHFLLNYTRSRGVGCTSWMWWKCFMSAVNEGDEKTARRYRTKAAQAAKRESRTRTETGTVQGAVEEQRPDADPERDGAEAELAEYESEQAGNTGAHVRPGHPKAAVQADRMRSAKIRDLINARTHSRLERVLVDIESRLDDSDPSANHAWAHLIDVSRKDDTVSAADLESLRATMADKSMTSHAYTSLMLGLLERGDPNGAWEVWRDLVERERQSVSAGSSSMNGKTRGRKRYIDRVALAIGAHVCYAFLGLEAAIKLVDAWAKRSTGSQAHDESAHGHGLEQTVILDSTNVNVLLTLCRHDRKPGIAFRIFKAALPRWGVYTDDISLTLLLDTCRHQDFASEENQSDTLRDRLRQLADELRIHRPSRSSPQSGKYDAYDASGFARGPTSVLLDQPGSNWRSEHDETPWSKGRSVFRDVVLSNRPSLKYVHSPLDFEKGPYAHLSRDISSFFRLAPSSSTPTDTETGHDIPQHANYAHLVPSSNTFRAYITLLGYHNLPHEIPVALAWMRYLGITPTKRTMLLALTYLGEVEGPRRVLADWEGGKSQLVRDTEVVRRWLSEWVAKGVPSEDEVARYRRETVEANRRLTA